MDMLDMPVTLIVKAPNQQIEDQTIKCESTWTIKRLKGYLSEVYPSKPRTEDQKLIYSGQLLPDSVILRDILRWYEGQEAHTVHLVCTPSREQNYKTPNKMTESSKSESVPISGSDNRRGSSSNTSISSTPDGLRQRLASGSNSSTPSVSSSSSQVLTSPSGRHVQVPAPDPRATWAAAVAQPYVNDMPAGAYDPNNVVQQMVWMQQAYAYYMTQYMQMLASAPSAHNNYGQAPYSVPPNAMPQPPPEEPAVIPAANNQQEPAMDANVIGGADEDDRGNRDWLYWIYFLSRLMVLFSIVYFYSSPTRFVVVSALGIVMYLYQVGFFGIQAPAAIPQPAPENIAQAAPAPAVIVQRAPENDVIQAAPERLPNENAIPVNNAGTPVVQSQGERERDDNVVQDRPSLLAITWTFFSSFFASLIPEQPGAL